MSELIAQESIDTINQEVAAAKKAYDGVTKAALIGFFVGGAAGTRDLLIITHEAMPNCPTVEQNDPSVAINQISRAFTTTQGALDLLTKAPDTKTVSIAMQQRASDQCYANYGVFKQGPILDGLLFGAGLILAAFSIRLEQNIQTKVAQKKARKRV